MNSINYFNYSPEKVRMAKMTDPIDDQFFMPIVALSYGNASKYLYDPYRNYKPMILNDKNSLLLALQAYNFILIDLGLYLDTHPDDEEALKLYRNCLLNYKVALEKFEKVNYPITIDSVNATGTKWPWMNNWQVKGEDA